MTRSTRLPLALARGSYSEEAYRAIRERILRGEFPLGAPLSRRELAGELGMSFLPVSEAIRQLERDGLVESLPRVGTRVRIPTVRDVEDCYIVREALECQAARLFAERASPQAREELRTMARRLDALEQRCSKRSATADARYQTQSDHIKLHLRIAECTGCVTLRDLIESNQVLIFNWLFDMSMKTSVNPPRWHRDLIDAVAGADPQVAWDAMHRHVGWGLDAILDHVRTRFGNNLPFRRKRYRVGRENPILR